MRVYVTRPIPAAGLELLSELEVSVYEEAERLPPRSALLAGAGGADGILSLLTERIDAEVMDRAPNLRVISNMAVGYDNIDVAEARRRGVMVCNTPGVLTETTADFTWALMMAVARRVVEGDGYVRAGRFPGWGPLMLLGRDLHGATLGIVGNGRIGQAVARRAAGFGMEVLVHRGVPLEALLERSDFVSLHVPLSGETTHMIGARELARMKPTAYLINTSRGPVVDETALVEALASGAIAGAALDVFEREPAVHEGLLGLENVVLAPHIASASVATRDRMAVMAATNLLQALRGDEPNHRVC